MTEQNRNANDFKLLRAEKLQLHKLYALKARSVNRQNATEEEQAIHTAIERGIKKLQPNKFSRMLQRLGFMNSTILSGKVDKDIIENGFHHFKVRLSQQERSPIHALKQLLWFKAPKLSENFDECSVSGTETFKFWKEYFNELGIEYNVIDTKTHSPDIGKMAEGTVMTGVLGGVIGLLLGGAAVKATGSMAVGLCAYFGSVAASAKAGNYLLNRKLDDIGYIKFSIMPKPYCTKHLDEKYADIDKANKTGNVMSLGQQSNDNKVHPVPVSVPSVR